VSQNNYYRNTKYTPGQSEEYKLSRSKIELFMQCPRCLWLEARMGIKRPSGPPFSLNKAVDELFKKEFDSYRNKKQPHPLMIENGLQAIPFNHPDLNDWRENFVGVRYKEPNTNFLVFGAIDDVWVTTDNELIVVDYKATSKKSEININSDWQISYKRQVEIYQWLLRMNGFKVSNVAYFVYTNGLIEPEGFYNKLEFETKLIEYKGNDQWVLGTLNKIKECLDGDIPEVGTAAMGGECDFCSYARQRTAMTLKSLPKNKPRRV
jgi:CRISPR/Cas system-associated exonuclease Cas4 (RecB family)